VALAPTTVCGPVPMDESIGSGLAALVALATDGQTNRHNVHLSNDVVLFLARSMMPR
jgi:hypothetical protein